MASTPSAPPGRETRPRPSAATAAAVGVAAAAMVATLPGRTHGLGLVTEPLLADLGLARVPYAALNFWATLAGAVFCVPAGWAVDRLGLRPSLAAVLLALGAVVVAMAGVAAGGRPVGLLVPEVFFGGGVAWSAVPLDLFLPVLLTRGLGQSALSVVSLALVGKVAGRKPGLVIGFYSFLVALGFMAAFAGVKATLETPGVGWRALWAGMGWVLVGFGVLAAFVVREPRAMPEAGPEPGGDADAPPAGDSLTLRDALLAPAFWVFALATSFYGLVAAGLSLFNQSVLAERGFDRGVFLAITTAMPLVGLAANLGAGFLAARVRLGVLLAAALFVQAVALVAFPHVTTLAHVYAYAAAMSVSGGVLTVVFFTVWRQAFGPRHLGRIQGAAQFLTVVASAAGPLVLAAGQRAYGSYAPVMQAFAAVAAAFAAAALLVPLPRKDPPE